jgi:ribose/xylose/arabinose/galactoside ABC-type transport system permease subunit
MRRLLNNNRDLLALIAVLFGVAVVMFLFSPERFLAPNNLRSMAFQLPEIGILTLAMMVAMLHGGINLAVVGTANLTAIITALVVHAAVPAVGNEWLAAALGLVAGFAASLLVGVLSGILVGYVGVSSILTTLGTMTLVNGVCIVITGGSTISRLPAPILAIGNGVLFGIPIPLLVFLLCSAGLWVVLSRTVFGFNLYMLGTNAEATRYAGISNPRILLGVYLLSSFLASIAGLIMMARFNSAKADYGQSYLLLTILAAVLGGTSASGGYGRAIGVVFAIIMLQMLASGLNLLGVDPFFAIAMWGAILLTVETLNHFLRHRA